jgi:hypothetical protein
MLDLLDSHHGTSFKFKGIGLGTGRQAGRKAFIVQKLVGIVEDEEKGEASWRQALAMGTVVEPDESMEQASAVMDKAFEPADIREAVWQDRHPILQRRPDSVLPSRPGSAGSRACSRPVSASARPAGVRPASATAARARPASARPVTTHGGGLSSSSSPSRPSSARPAGVRPASATAARARPASARPVMTQGGGLSSTSSSSSSSSSTSRPAGGEAGTSASRAARPQSAYARMQSSGEVVGGACERVSVSAEMAARLKTREKDSARIRHLTGASSAAVASAMHEVSRACAPRPTLVPHGNALTHSSQLTNRVVAGPGRP